MEEWDTLEIKGDEIFVLRKGRIVDSYELDRFIAENELSDEPTIEDIEAVFLGDGYHVKVRRE